MTDAPWRCIYCGSLLAPLPSEICAEHYALICLAWTGTTGKTCGATFSLPMSRSSKGENA